MARTELVGVTKRFGDNAVVKQVNLVIEDGGFVVLVGPSGCGKSTTLRMVAGLEQPTEGIIKIGEQDVTHLTPRDRDVAMVFQSYALYPHMSIYENISFGLKLRKMPASEIDVRVREAADILGIQDLLERKPKQLSGGQRQRVAMGRAIVRKPAVFLFDEPLSNLDAKLRVQMRVEIAKLHQKLGTTTIYVTHDQVEAMTLAKQIVVMNDGWVQQVGAPLEVYKRPVNTFVAGFVGSPAMNFFPCELDGKGGTPRVAGKGFDVEVPAHLRVNAGEKGRKLTLGIRPEHLHEAPAGQGLLHGLVDVLEPLGAEVLALGHIEGQPFTASLSPDTRVKVGDTVPLTVGPEEIHLFDRESGRTLDPSAVAA
jgi:ABC-type sugar transport system ATPase subunit